MISAYRNIKIMFATKTALVTAATGVVGRNLAKHLLALPDGDAICVSRREPDLDGDYRHISVDLLDPASCEEKLGSLPRVTHFFRLSMSNVRAGRSL